MVLIYDAPGGVYRIRKATNTYVLSKSKENKDEFAFVCKSNTLNEVKKILMSFYNFDDVKEFDDKFLKIDFFFNEEE